MPRVPKRLKLTEIQMNSAMITMRMEVAEMMGLTTDHFLDMPDAQFIRFRRKILDERNKTPLELLEDLDKKLDEL